jgi:glycosyltransferase involved in cell wall biosynthesis
LNRLITISNHGENYLSRRYPWTRQKLKTRLLGIKQDDFPLNTAPNESDNMHVVSCSWVGTRKNLGRVFQSLKNENATWTHLGDGEKFDELKAISNQSSFLKVNLPGKLTPDEIRQYYSQTPITCFISLSTNEGLPVSMMEAQAFGIPIVSSNVGGCGEIVTTETGVLLPENYNDADVVNAVRYCAEKFSSPESRQRIQEFCKEKFSAEENYESFLDFLDEENQKHLQKYT